MLDIKKLQNNPFFKIKNLKVGEILFDEGDKDDNLYIVLEGELKIEKLSGGENNERKTLNFLKKNDVFGEGSLSNNEAKEVKISAKIDSSLLKISAKDFESFVENDTKFGVKTLLGIINILNKRLLESNSLLITSYNIRKAISEKQDYSNKSLFKIIDKSLQDLAINYILLFEKNPIIKDYFKFEYDTRKKGKMLDEIIKIKSELKEENIKENIKDLEKHNYIEKLVNKDESIGYLVFGKDNYFSENEIKTIKSIGKIIASFIKQRQDLEEKKYEKAGLYN